MDITKSGPAAPAVGEDEIAALARKIGRDWAKAPEARSVSSVIQRMPHGRTRPVAVEVKRSHRVPKRG